jgi:hypothetical protein
VSEVRGRQANSHTFDYFPARFPELKKLRGTGAVCGTHARARAMFRLRSAKSRALPHCASSLLIAGKKFITDLHL